MTDPSFARQLITFTTAHVGNYGVSAAAWESDRIHAAGAIMREAINTDRRARGRAGLARLAGRRTASRASPGSTRGRWCGTSASAGAMRGGIFPARDAAPRRRDGPRARRAVDGRPRPRARGDAGRAARSYGEGGGLRIVALDTGIKRSIVRNFVDARRAARAVPVHDAGRRAARRATPTASSSCPGPGDPAALDYVVDTIRALLVRKPVFGICLGHQLLSRAAGPGDVQAPVRPPRRQPPGQGPRDRPDRDHLPEPRLRGGRRGSATGSSPTSAPPS